MKLNLHTSLKHKNDDMKTSLLKKRRKLPLLATLLLFVGLTVPVGMWGQTQNQLLSQNFDGSGFQIHLDEYAAGAWYAYNAGSGNNWILYEYTTNNYCAAYAWNSSYAANCYLVSQPFTVSAQMTELSVSLDESVAGSSFAETFEVFFVRASDVTTLAGVASATHYSAIASASYTNTTYAQVSGSSTNSALKGQSVRLVVHCTSAADKYRLHIDNITVTETTSASTHTLTTAVSPSGAGTVTSGGSMAQGATKSLTATANSGYVFDHWTVSGTGATLSSTSSNPTTFTMGTANATVTAYFTAGSGGGSCVEIATEATASSSGTYGGIYTYYNRYAYTQQIYTAAELTAAGASAGVIESIALKYAETTASALTFDVYLGQTTQTTVPTTWITNANLTLAYSGTTTFSGEGEWNNIDVSSAGFEWDGTSNIVVAIHRTDNTQGSVTYPDFYYINSTNMMAYYANQSTFTLNGSHVPSNNGTNNSQRPAMKFCITEPVTCAQIGTGTSTSNRVPINTYYNYFTTQSLYTASEVNAAIGNNTLINSLSFYHNAYNATYNIKIYLAHTSQTALSASSAVTTATEVFNSNGNMTVGGSSAGWQTFDLDTPFQYNGTDNLLVIVSGTGSYNTSLYWNYTTVSNSVLHRGNDNTTAYADLSQGNSVYGYTLANTRPNIQICGTTPPSSCPAPTDLAVSNITPSSATVSWNGEADSYNVRYRTVTLQSGTETAIFTEGFESTSIPTGWTTYANDYTSTSTDWGIRNFTDVTAHGGSYYISSRSYDGSTDRSVDNWLITPQVTLDGRLKFWMMDDGTFHDYIAVYVSTTGTAVSDFTLVKEPGKASNTWTEVTVDLFNYAGQQGYIAIRHIDEGQDVIYIDDFGIYTYTYTYGAWQDATPGDGSATISSLSSETIYEVQVQGDCDSDGTSAWSTIRFETLSACTPPIDLNATNITSSTATLSWSDYQDSYNVRYRGKVFFEDFNSGIPSTWTCIDSDGDGYNWGYTGFGMDDTYAAYSASYINDIGALTPDNWLISPQLDLQGFFEVWLLGQDNSDYVEHYAIYVSTTGYTISDFTSTTPLVEGNTTNTYQRATANLSSYSGQQGWIAIRHYNCTNQYMFCVDNFGVYTSDWITTTANDASASISSLLPSTEYVWQVKGSNCTDWSALATFTTLEAYTITATASPTAGGTVQVGSATAGSTSSQLVNLGSDVTIVATAASGYYFVNWTNDNGGAVVATTASYTVSNVTAAASYTANFRQAPHTIANTTDWNNFAEAVSCGYDYSGETVNMTGDVSITSQANQAGANDKFFKGTFNGNCNTITVNMTATGDFCAPFYAIQNATINDLVVTGTITSSYHDAAGFCGGMYGNSTFNNCVSNVAITSTRPSYEDTRSACGGFAGKSGGGDNPTFIGCAFTGSLSAISEKWGGFIGFHASRSGWSGTFYGRSTFTNCICAPTSITVNGITDNATFVSGYNENQYLIMTVTNSYYNEEAAKLGTKQGKQAYTVAGGSNVTVAMSGATSYTCSGIDAYSPGMVFDGDIIGGSGEVLALVLGYTGTCTLAGYTTTTGSLSGSATTGTNDAYTLTMAAANATIGVTENCVTTWVDAVTSQPSGYSETTVEGVVNVTISSEEGLAWLISVVNGLNEQPGTAITSSTIVTLTADLNMSKSGSDYIWVPIGTAGHPFIGTFDGNFHTISGLHIADADEIAAVESTLGAQMQYTGLFGLTGNATIKNLYVKETNLTNSATNGSLGGIVGSNGGTVQNCYSDATLSGTATNKGGIAGANTGTLSNSYTMVTSGVAGSNTGTINNCYSKAATNNNPGAGEFTSAVAYTYGDYTTNNAVDNKPLVEWLNTSNPDNTVKWIRPKGSLKINDGYPVLVEASSSGIMAVVGVTNNKNIYKGEANAMITTYGANSNADIYIYSSGTLTKAPTAANLFIDEDVAIKQSGDAANAAISATVGITIDNSSASGSGSEHRDYHTFASSLVNAPLGITYPNSTEYAQNVEMVEGTHYNMLTTEASYFPTGVAGTNIDYYDFYEPQYHWINLKRNPQSHWHQDNPTQQISYDQGSTLKHGRGYLLAIGTPDGNHVSDATKKVYLSAKGTLQNGDVKNVEITASGTHLTGYNFLGNPYQSYLDFDAFASENASAIWGDDHSDGYMAYLIYDADKGGFDEYLSSGGVSFSQGSLQTASRYIHPHQGFFVVMKGSGTKYIDFKEGMRVTDKGSAFRDEQPTYPLVNLVCTDDNGKREISVIEVERPSMAGSLRMKGMLGAKANMYIRWDDEDFGNVFLTGTPEYVPVWFKSVEEGVFTMTWSTANDNFGYLHLIDNLTGNDIDMLTTDSYAFQSRPSDSKARFRLVFSPLGIDEETTEQGENFAFINGNELVVNGEGELSFIDLNGRVLATEYVSGQQSHIAMPKVAVGMYMLRLSNSDGVKVQKIVVRK